MSDLETLFEILQANKEKTFVKRILNRGEYPVLNMGEGKTATHLMSWGESDGRNIVFPTVVLDEDEKLKQYEMEVAFERALSDENFIEFQTAEEADWFSKNYKKYWQNGKE